MEAGTLTNVGFLCGKNYICRGKTEKLQLLLPLVVVDT